MNYQKLSCLSQDEFEDLFNSSGTVIMETMEFYNPQLIFDSIISIIRKIIVYGSRNLEIRQTALDIIKEVKPHDVWNEVKSIVEWIQDNINYVGDGFNVEQFQLPTKTLKEKRGDCDCIALLMCSLLRSIGHNAGVILTNTQGKSEIDHAMGCVSFRKDIVLLWGVKEENDKVKVIGQNLIDKIPIEYRVPIKTIKGSSDGIQRWIALEGTEKKEIGWIPDKSTYMVVITPEIVNRIDINK